jgi:hypothetical protein
MTFLRSLPNKYSIEVVGLDVVFIEFSEAIMMYGSFDRWERKRIGRILIKQGVFEPDNDAPYQRVREVETAINAAFAASYDA